MIERLRIDQALRAAVVDGVAPAIAFAVSRGEAPPQCWFAGREGPEPDAPPCNASTRFDLASLTKPLCTTIWILRLIEAGRLDFERPIGASIRVADPALAAVPLWRLMSHTAGLPAHRRYFEGLGPALLQSGRFDRARAALRRMLASGGLAMAPGAAEEYSDLGFLLIEWIAEAADGPLAARWPSLPGHGPDALHFRPVGAATAAPDSATGYAPTERCALRGRLLRGEVHDENAWVMGGVAGHAGLFGDVLAVHDLARRWMRALAGDADALGIAPGLARAAVDRRWMHPRGTRVLGWDTPTPGRSAAGRGFGRLAFGHLGFTGTSLWLDPHADVVMVLLTNRVCPTRDNESIRAFRPAIHDAAWAWLRSRFT